MGANVLLGGLYNAICDFLYATLARIIDQADNAGLGLVRTMPLSALSLLAGMFPLFFAAPMNVSSTSTVPVIIG